MKTEPNHGAGWDLVWGLQRAQVDYEPGGRNHPSVLTLTLTGAGPGGFELRPRSRFAPWLEHHGLLGRILTGDPGFDAEWELSSDQPAFAAAGFASEPRRKAAEALFAKGCARLVLQDGELKGMWSPWPEDRDVTALSPCVGHLGAVAEDLPLVPASAPGLTRSGFGWLLAGSWVVLVIAWGVLALSGAVVHPVDTVRLFLATCLLSLPAAVVCMVLAGRAMARKAWGIGPMARLALTCLVAFPAFGYLLGAALNQRLDRGPAEVHRVQVVDKYLGKGKGRPRMAVLRSWRAAGSETVRVSQSEYDLLAPGRTVLVLTTRPGWLGFEYAVDSHFEW